MARRKVPCIDYTQNHIAVCQLLHCTFAEFLEENSMDCSADNNEIHENHWIKLPAAPQTWLSKPIRINDSEFVTASEKMKSSNNNSGAGIFRFNTFTNEWTVYWHYPGSIELYIEYPTICLGETNHLFIYSRRNTLLILNLETFRYQIKYQFNPSTTAGFYDPCTIIGDTFHLFVGCEGHTHLRFNTDEGTAFELNERTEIHNFSEYASCENPGLIKVESKQMLLHFGGYDSQRDYAENTTPYPVYCYRYDNNDGNGKWEQFHDLSMPYNIRLFGFCITTDDRYVLVIGGKKLDGIPDADRKYGDQLWILDVEQGMFIESKVKCPVASAWHSVVMPQHPLDGVLVHGYLRGNCDVELPVDVMEMIVNWYSSECVHALKDDGHWKIPINYLFCENSS